MKNLADIAIPAAGHRIDVKERHDGVTILLDGAVLYDSDQEAVKEVEESSGFEEDLRALLNRYSMENASDTPDFILARFVMMTLQAHTEATERRDEWYGVTLEPGNVQVNELAAEFGPQR